MLEDIQEATLSVLRQTPLSNDNSHEEEEEECFPAPHPYKYSSCALSEDSPVRPVSQALAGG